MGVPKATVVLLCRYDTRHGTAIVIFSAFLYISEKKTGFVPVLWKE
jgi:hypothetical protein